MITDLPIKRILALSQWQTVLPTRWRQKSTGIDMEQNYVTVTLCIARTRRGSKIKVIGQCKGFWLWLWLANTVGRFDLDHLSTCRTARTLRFVHCVQKKVNPLKILRYHE